MYVSLKDVAKRAGVSFQTASKVLNGQRGVVAKQTRERILTAARELGYVPNAVARSLVKRTTYTIGIVADDLSDWVLAQFVVGAEREALRRGHAVIIRTVHGEGSDAEACIRTLLERRVDGVLAAAPSLEDDQRVAEVLRRRIPAVRLHHVPGGGVPVVGSDHVAAARLATEHLMDLGHRRIASVTGPPRRRVVADRLRGYREALESAGLTYDPTLVESAEWEPGSAYQAAGRLLEHDPPPTAIFVQSDLMAVGVLSALNQRGVRIPDDCAVIGFDDLPLAPYLAPPLTSVHVPFLETGERAVRLLLERISGEGEEGGTDTTPPRVLLPVSLEVRESTAGPKEATWHG